MMCLILQKNRSPEGNIIFLSGSDGSSPSLDSERKLQCFNTITSNRKPLTAFEPIGSPNRSSATLRGFTISGMELVTYFVEFRCCCASERMLSPRAQKRGQIFLNTFPTSLTLGLTSVAGTVEVIAREKAWPMASVVRSSRCCVCFSPTLPSVDGVGRFPSKIRHRDLRPISVMNAVYG